MEPLFTCTEDMIKYFQWNELMNTFTNGLNTELKAYVILQPMSFMEAEEVGRPIGAVSKS